MLFLLFAHQITVYKKRYLLSHVQDGGIDALPFASHDFLISHCLQFSMSVNAAQDVFFLNEATRMPTTIKLCREAFDRMMHVLSCSLRKGITQVNDRTAAV